MCNLSLSQKQIILGGLLGDSYFNNEKNFVRFSHCAKQLEYLEWKYNFFVTKANIHSVYHTWNGNKFLQYYFQISKKYMDKDKPALISNGAWISEDNYELEEVLNFGHKLNIGFHANSFYAPALSFTDIYNQNKKMMQNSFDARVFVNGWLGLPYSEDDLTGAEFEIDVII